MEHVMAKTEHANLDIRVFDKSNPNGICAHLRNLWETRSAPERFSLASLSPSRAAAPADESPDGGVWGRVLS